MNETLQSITSMACPLITVIVGMVVLMMDLGERKAGRAGRLIGVSLAGLAVAALASAQTLLQAFLPPSVEPGLSFGGGMAGDRFGGTFCLLLCIIAALAIAMSDKYLAERGINHGEFYALILFSTSGAMLMALAYDLLNVFLGLEVLSVALYILSGFARREMRSEESAVKYFLLGAFASGFFLFGIALVYGAVGIGAQNADLALDQNTSLTNFSTIRATLAATMNGPQSLIGSPLFVTGIALIIVGLGFKAALVPFHAYAPDVYEGAPTSVTAFMSAGAKVGAFAAFIRLLQVVLPVEGAEVFRSVIWGLAAATMVVGNILAVRQTNIKRMLAYSSIAHAGYILVGVLAAGVAAENTTVTLLSQSAVLYYLFAYTFMNLGAFALVIWLGRDGREFTDISDYAGLAKENPAAAAVMSIFMLSLAGIPPAAGFFGKLYLFLGAMEAGLTTLAVLGLLVSVIGVYYYLNIILTMYFRPSQHSFAGARAGGARTTALIAAAATLLFGVLRVSAFAPQSGTPQSPQMAFPSPGGTGSEEASSPVGGGAAPTRPAPGGAPPASPGGAAGMGNEAVSGPPGFRFYNGQPIPITPPAAPSAEKEVRPVPERAPRGKSVPNRPDETRQSIDGPAVASPASGSSDAEEVVPRDREEEPDAALRSPSTTKGVEENGEPGIPTTPPR